MNNAIYFNCPVCGKIYKCRRFLGGVIVRSHKNCKGGGAWVNLSPASRELEKINDEIFGDDLKSEKEMERWS